MTGDRKIWETLVAIPDPHEAGVVYVTQKLAGFEQDISDHFGKSTKFEKVHHTAAPVTRVQRCRLHANGRLENTDIAPDKINDTQKVMLVRGDGSGSWSHSHWGLATNANGANEVLVKPAEKRWLEDEVPMPPVMALGVLRQWLKTPGTHVALVGHSGAKMIRTNFMMLLMNNGGLTDALGAHEVRHFVSTNLLQVSYADSSLEPSVIEFYAVDSPNQMRGPQVHHFMIEAAALKRDLPKDDSGLDALDNLRLMTRLGDNPDGIVLDRF